MRGKDGEKVETYLLAYLPPTTAAAKIGSVGVKQAAITSEERNDRPGINA